MVRSVMAPRFREVSRMARPMMLMAALTTTCCKQQQSSEAVTTTSIAPQATAVATASVLKPRISAVGKISLAIIESASVPTGYNGADGKVKADPQTGAISFTQDAMGNDVGFFVEFMPVSVGDSKNLVVDIQGKVFQRQGWAKFGSIQVLDKSGQRHILRKLCQSVFDDCTQPLVVDISAGKTLEIKLPPEVKDIKRFEMVFVGQTKVFADLTVKNIDLK